MQRQPANGGPELPTALKVDRRNERRLVCCYPFELTPPKPSGRGERGSSGATRNAGSTPL